MADFSDGVMVSECPNLLLHSVKKKPAAATVLKKPAAQEPRQQEETPPLEAAPEKEEEKEEGSEEEEKEKDSEVEASAEEAEDEPEESERKEEKKKAQRQEFPVKSRNYCILYYQKDNRIGMRQCFGNRRQVFSFGGKSCEKSEEALRAIGREAAERLKGGMSEGDCAVWCREQAGA